MAMCASGPPDLRNVRLWTSGRGGPRGGLSRPIVSVLIGEAAAEARHIHSQGVIKHVIYTNI